MNGGPLAARVEDAASLRLRVVPLPADQAARGVVRLDPADLARLGVETGGLLRIDGSRTGFARALPAAPAGRGRAEIAIDGTLRRNAGCAIGDDVTISACAPPREARSLRAAGAGSCLPTSVLRRALEGIPISAGDNLRLPLAGGREAELRVAVLDPPGPCLMGSSTRIERAADGTDPPAGPDVRHAEIRYDDVGGLGPVMARIREVVEWPLRYPEAFAALGISPPKGVLLAGPPGTGKTLIARAVAAESGAHFIAVNGPEIVDKFYGASEQQLRSVFERARKHAPSIVFIDELDAIAPRREALSSEKQVERRIVAQLLTLLDGLAGRGEVIVLAATNLPDSIDPALRRPGRFDREIRIDPPDVDGRREILAVHTRGMPLAPDVDLARLAEATVGHVGADLAALCREAALAALRRLTSCGGSVGIASIDPAELRVIGADFASAGALVAPSALREMFVEVPRVRWADVVGIDTVRDALTRAVEWPLRRPALFARMGLAPPRGVLLNGRPGTGKTLLARALATEAGASFIAVNGPQLLSEMQGASERALRQVFARARGAAPCIVFFDEFDALAPRRGSAGSGTDERMVAQLLTELDGISPLEGVVLLAATNRADRIDPALLRPGRIDLIIDMPEPDEAARRAILARHADRMPLETDVSLAAIAADTPGWVGAQLAGLCRLAALQAIGRAPDAATASVTAADFAAARARMSAP